MNQQAITKSKIYNITSKNATNLNGSMNSYVQIALPNLISKSDNVLNIYFSILHAELPNSFYLVNSSNNTIIINNITYIVPNGNYNANSLITSLYSILPVGFSISYNATQLKFIFSYTTGFTISMSSTINKIIGGDLNNDMVSSGNVLIMPNVVNFLPLPRVLFRSKQLNFNNYNQGDNSNDVFLSVQNNANLGSMIFYNNYTQLRFLYENDINNLGILEIRLTDDLNNLLDLNGQDFYITFQVDIVFIPEKSPLSFSNIVSNVVLQ